MNVEQNLEFCRLYFSCDVCVGDLFLVSVFIKDFVTSVVVKLRSVCLSVSLSSCSIFVVNKRQYITINTDSS